MITEQTIKTIEVLEDIIREKKKQIASYKEHITKLDLDLQELEENIEKLKEGNKDV